MGLGLYIFEIHFESLSNFILKSLKKELNALTQNFLSRSLSKYGEIVGFNWNKNIENS